MDVTVSCRQSPTQQVQCLSSLTETDEGDVTQKEEGSGNLTKDWKLCHNPSQQLMGNRIHQVGSLWLQIRQVSLGGCTQSWPSYPPHHVLQQPDFCLPSGQLHTKTLLTWHFCARQLQPRCLMPHATEGRKVWGCLSSWETPASESCHPGTAGKFLSPAEPTGMASPVTTHRTKLLESFRSSWLRVSGLSH